MSSQQKVVSDDLLDGYDSLVSRLLGLDEYRSRKAALTLSGREPLGIDGVQFVTQVFEFVRGGWDRALKRGAAGSEENFRWFVPQLALSQHNTSPEVTLERHSIRARTAAGNRDWSNQVPLISGIADSKSHKRRAVDLVHRRSDTEFEFVELKVNSDTPLYAACEILQYGLLWLLSRRDSSRLKYDGRPILEATTLHLSVLAPGSFYTPDLREFARALDHGISTLGRQFGVGMGFSQWAFQRDLVWSYPCPYSDPELIALLDTRERV